LLRYLGAVAAWKEKKGKEGKKKGGEPRTRREAYGGKGGGKDLRVFSSYRRRVARKGEERKKEKKRKGKEPNNVEGRIPCRKGKGEGRGRAGNG